MVDQYVGEIRMFAGQYAPMGWALCNGQLLSISENEVLFALIGTTYGGDGYTTFAIPDLRGRVPIHQGTSSKGTTFTLGQMGGSEKVTLSVSQLPSHTHMVNVTNKVGTERTPSSNTWAEGLHRYSVNEPTGIMSQEAITHEGGNQAHNNIMPFTALHFIIATEGIFPPQG